jgi:hypothetical protein
MSVDVGSAVGNLDLNIQGFLDGLRSAQAAAAEAARTMEKSFLENFEAVGESMQTIGKNASLYISAPIGGALAASVKFASDFESAMKNVEAITQMTGEELSAMEQGIFAISRT